MIYPNPDKLEKTGSRYGLVTLAAKRAKQIKNGANPLVTTDSPNPLTIALEEIAAGKLTFVVPDFDKPTRNIEEHDISGIFSLAAFPAHLEIDDAHDDAGLDDDWALEEDEPSVDLDEDNDRVAAVDEFVSDESGDTRKALQVSDEDEDGADLSDIEPDISEDAVIDGEWSEDNDNDNDNEGSEED